MPLGVAASRRPAWLPQVPRRGTSSSGWKWPAGLSGAAQLGSCGEVASSEGHPPGSRRVQCGTHREQGGPQRQGCAQDHGCNLARACNGVAGLTNARLGVCSSRRGTNFTDGISKSGNARPTANRRAHTGGTNRHANSAGRGACMVVLRRKLHPKISRRASAKGVRRMPSRCTRCTSMLMSCGLGGSRTTLEQCTRTTRSRG